jgi:alkane 1-monooxygenase
VTLAAKGRRALTLRSRSRHDHGMQSSLPLPSSPAPAGSVHAWRFAIAWLFPISVTAAAWNSPWLAYAVGTAIQIGMALIELLPSGRHSPPAAKWSPWFAWCVRVHVPLQAVLLGIGLWSVQQQPATGMGFLAAIALGLGVGSVTGSQGITFAHELGHSKSQLDRVLGWCLMASVNYGHFMIEHFRGHHPRAATHADPASARRGETLWRFLPRTLSGGLRSAWNLERQQLRTLRRPWSKSPLLWVTAAQVTWLIFLGAAFGPLAVVFWLVQSAYAVFLLETINYIEHYGLVRSDANGKREPFAVHHAWNADHWLTNSLIANLQRHSDHHMHAWKPYATLEPLPGPQLPTGYAGCIWLAAVPPLWFKVMHARLEKLAA